MKIYFIPHDHARAVWPRVKEHLLPAIKQSNGRWTPEYVLAGLVTGEQTLWTAVDDDGECVGATTTEIIQYPEKRYVALHFLGGIDFGNWYKELLEVITLYATDSQCDGIECNARFGFWTHFKHDGFKRKSVFYEKEL
jgi:hypothetical protein